MRAIVPEDLPKLRRADERASLTSLVRASIATAMGALNRTTSPGDIVRRAWPDDREARLLLRSPVTTLTTADAPSLVPVSLALLASLQPRSAAASLFAQGLSLDFSSGTVSIPAIAPISPVFTAEGAPIPAANGAVVPGVMLEPKKLALLVGLSGEMIRHSEAEKIVRATMIESCGAALDGVVFSANAGDDATPAGILHGIPALTPTAGGGADEMIADLSALAQAIAPVSGSGQIAFIVAPKQRIAMSALPSFPHTILESGSLQSGTVIATATAGIVSSTGGSPQIDASRDALVHEHTEALPVSTPGSPPVTSAPLRSYYQTDGVGLRLRWPLSWARRSDQAVAWIEDTSW